MYDGIYVFIFDLEEVFLIGLNRVVIFFVEKVIKGGGWCGVVVKLLKELGEYLELGGFVNVLDGCYGFYVKYGCINVFFLKEVELD